MTRPGVDHLSVGAAVDSHHSTLYMFFVYPVLCVKYIFVSDNLQRYLALATVFDTLSLGEFYFRFAKSEPMKIYQVARAFLRWAILNIGQ